MKLNKRGSQLDQIKGNLMQKLKKYFSSVDKKK